MKQLLHIFFLFITSLGISQIDSENNGSNKLKGIIGINNVPATEDKKPVSLEFNTNYNGFKTAKQKEKQKQAQQRKLQEQENKGILTREMLAKQTFKKNIESNFTMNFPQIDMDLGSFHTTSKNVHVSSYDFGRFDGDKVQITINGKRIHNNYLLTPRIKTITIPLKIGINKIEVTALNEGDLSPNTGYFSFIDDSKYIIKEGQWMLAKGAKVIAIIVRNEK